MKSPVTLLAIAVLAIGSLQASDGDDRTRPSTEMPQTMLGSGPIGTEPPNTSVTVGDVAPDFSFETRDHGWHHLRDLLAQGSVLLVFAPDDERLRDIEQEREGLLGRGIVPVAVLDQRERGVWETPERLGLHFSVLADPRGVIASQFNVEDPATRRATPAWFVLDRSGRVRGLRRQRFPEAGFLALAERALGLAGAGIGLPASAH